MHEIDLPYLFLGRSVIYVLSFQWTWWLKSKINVLDVRGTSVSPFHKHLPPPSLFLSFLGTGEFRIRIIISLTVLLESEPKATWSQNSITHNTFYTQKCISFYSSVLLYLHNIVPVNSSGGGGGTWSTPQKIVQLKNLKIAQRIWKIARILIFRKVHYYFMS